jgi:hypothetical protein
MGKIKIQNDRVIITINPKLYNMASIEQTINDYAGICDFEYDQVENKITLKNINKDIDLNIIGYEFCNYALSLMKR